MNIACGLNVKVIVFPVWTYVLREYNDPTLVIMCDNYTKTSPLPLPLPLHSSSGRGRLPETRDLQTCHTTDRHEVLSDSMSERFHSRVSFGLATCEHSCADEEVYWEEEGRIDRALEFLNRVPQIWHDARRHKGDDTAAFEEALVYHTTLF